MRALLVFGLLCSALAFGQGVTIPTAPVDSETTPLVRLKTSPVGWSYQSRSFEFETCNLGSATSKDSDNAEIGDVTFKIYNSSGTEITDQLTADTSCVKTVVDWEPTHNYEIIGGLVSAITAPVTDMRLWVVAVPDISYGLGGSRVFASGFNLRYLANNGIFAADGRTSKSMTYNATYHTNKIRAILWGTAGTKQKLMVSYEIFKP